VIVQPPARPGDKAFVIKQNGHTAFAGQLARHFGNDQFQRLEPSELVIPLVEWHDEGWTELDDRFLVDPDTHLPYSLTRTPLDEALPTSELSPTRGEARHPFIGLVSSMHSVGLFNGRFGLLADQSLLVKLPPAFRAEVEKMIKSETARQERLKAELLANPATAHLADESLVWHTYRALEFFDIFSLYIQCEHPSRQQETEIPHVPVDSDPEHDVTVTVTPIGESRFRLSPFPFDLDPFEPATPGRYLDPQPDGGDFAALWEAAEPAEHRVRLEA
jgi:hypothetical protein